MTSFSPSMTTDPKEPVDEAQRLTRRFDPQTETPTTAILETIEEHSGVDATDLPPLGERVNSDALNELIQQTPLAPATEPLEVTFVYAGYWVTVRNDASVTVTTHQPEDSSDGR